MAILQAVEPTATSSDPATARLEGMREGLNELVREAATGGDLAESVRFAQSQTAEQMARDVHPHEIGRGVAEQIALARKISPYWATRQLGSARAWWFDLPETYAALAAGTLSERVAEAVVAEARHLDAATRRRVEPTPPGPGPNGRTGGSACGRRRTPCRS